uniref:Uncharacterized protein n=1 Tax=Anguilla anguilla TaxID=7936 RepID=A0A0E9SAW4_ANGAN
MIEYKFPPSCECVSLSGVGLLHIWQPVGLCGRTLGGMEPFSYRMKI